jgi:hypothetical protein
MKKILHTRPLTYITLIVLLILPFLVDDSKSIFDGSLAILTHPSLLISDYLRIGGLGASLLNLALLMVMNVTLIRLLKLKLNGPIFAGLLTIAGFAFFGKNLINALPIYLGIYLNSKFQKVEFKSLIIVLLFSTGIGPIVSYLIFGTGWAYYIAIPAGIIIGILTGFILPILSAHMVRFHKGYNLYNIGFTMGIVSLFFSAILRSVFKLDLFSFDTSTTQAYHGFLYIMILGGSVLTILLAWISNPKAYKDYPKILKSSGRLASDYMRETSKETAMLNVGIMGLISLLFITVLDIQINGPVFSGILTVMGFAAFGKHPKNSIPVMLGATIWFLYVRYTTGTVGTGLQIAVLFVTAIAPVAGRHGFWVGILAGFTHVMFTPLAYPFQGGFDLYNNGFAAGFVAAIMIPIFDFIRKDKITEDTP